MTLHDDIMIWVDQSRYDLETARAMLLSGRFLYVLFTCQQATEKMLKALVVKNTEKFPPRIHDLTRLAELAGLELSQDQVTQLSRLSLYYIEARYPEEVSNLAREVDRELAADLLNQTEVLLQWLEQQVK